MSQFAAINTTNGRSAGEREQDRWKTRANQHDRPDSVARGGAENDTPPASISLRNRGLGDPKGDSSPGRRVAGGVPPVDLTGTFNARGAQRRRRRQVKTSSQTRPRPLRAPRAHSRRARGGTHSAYNLRMSVDIGSFACYPFNMSAKLLNLEEQLRTAIQESGLTPTALARVTGVDQAVLSRFVNGDRGVTLNTAARVAAHLGLALRPVSNGKTQKGAK